MSCTCGDTFTDYEMLSGLTLGGICIKDHEYHDTIEKLYVVANLLLLWDSKTTKSHNSRPSPTM